MQCCVIIQLRHPLPSNEMCSKEVNASTQVMNLIVLSIQVKLGMCIDIQALLAQCHFHYNS